MGEWESAANVSGYNGMTSLKIRPKALSRHGRQWVYDWNGALVFNIGKVRPGAHARTRVCMCACAMLVWHVPFEAVTHRPKRSQTRRAQESKLKHLSLRSNIAVMKGEGKEVLYR